MTFSVRCLGDVVRCKESLSVMLLLTVAAGTDKPVQAGVPPTSGRPEVGGTSQVRTAHRARPDAAWLLLEQSPGILPRWIPKHAPKSPIDIAHTTFLTDKPEAPRGVGQRSVHHKHRV